MRSDDPLDDLGPEPLSEQVAPYRKYGDMELAVTLLAYAKMNGGPGISTPADTGYTHECQNCEENVRGISTLEKTLVCPMCDRSPGALTLGRGPAENQ